MTRKHAEIRQGSESSLQEEGTERILCKLSLSYLILLFAGTEHIILWTMFVT